jgi:copper chaperone NosL
MWKRCGIVVLVVTVALVLPWQVWAETVELPDGSKLDLSVECPVCTMKVTGGTPGPAAVVFKDSKLVGFDGASDLFRYLFAPEKYGFDTANVKSVYATDYSTKKFIDAKSAFFVLDSMVEGSMGPEVVPFSKKEDAEKFKAEHMGNRVVTYSDMKADDVKPKKKMLKMKHDEGSGHKMKH